ncbi:MAG: 30S ribosomal protein S17 [Candidatus Methylomirabilaceae bacterium]
MTQTASRGRRKALVGVVVSNKMQQTVVVMVERLVRHGAYSKMVRRRGKVKAHDEDSRCQIGDTVALMEIRPMSKEKRWLVMDVLEKASA